MSNNIHFKFWLFLSVLLLSACNQIEPIAESGTAKHLTNELLINAELSENGKHSATLSVNAIRVFDNDTGKQTFFYDIGDLQEPQRYSSISGDPKRIATAGVSTVHLFNLTSGQKLLSWRARATVEQAKISAIKLNHIGDKILVGFTDGSVSVTDLSAKTQLLYKVHSSDVRYLHFSQFEQYILTGASDSYLVLLSLENGQVEERFKFPSRITALELARGSELIFAADALSNDKIGNLKQRSLPEQLSYVERNRHFRAAKFAPDKQRLITAAAKSGISVWDLASKDEIAQGNIKATTASSTTKGIAIVRDGFLTLSSDGVLQKWRLP